MPFITFGNEKEEVNFLVPDKFSRNLMEMGFTVVERTLIEQIFKELQLDYSGTISSENLKKIGKLLNIDLIVFGNVTYAHIPAQANAYNSVGDYYKLIAESLRIVDIETGEVMIISECAPSQEFFLAKYSLIEEISESIKQKLFPNENINNN